MSWFKTKKTERETDTASDALLPLVRTMADDLEGRSEPAVSLSAPKKLVGFHPEAAATSAPFFAAPGVDVGESIPDAKETSPFLRSTRPSAPENQVASAPAPANLPLHQSPLAKPMTLDATSSNVAVSVPPEVHPFAGVLPGGSMTSSNIAPFLTSKKGKIVIGAVGLLLTGGIAGGAYYLFVMKQDTALPASIANVPIVPPEQEPVTPSVPAVYQLDQPNVLSFDTETVTSGEIKNALLQAGQSIAREGLTRPIEFLVRDQKLNPLAFSRFAYLAKLEFPANLLEMLDEPFSLYIHIDSGRPRVALLVYAKNPEALALELEKSEQSLPLALEPLFLDMTTAPKSDLVFRDGAHLERPVRFTNIDSALGLSIDYALRGRQWVVGTSKETLRAVLDKTGL